MPDVTAMVGAMTFSGKSTAVPVVKQRRGADPRSTKLRLGGISKTFDGSESGASVEVLQDINLDIADGEFVAIVGPSGCGKSTILKLVSGLASPTSGAIEVDGKVIQGHPEGVGFMFQSDALLPWATVAENIGVGLDLGRCASGQQSARLDELIQLVGLKGFERFYPASLSGGMRQRVSLARTLAYEPSLFLLDEPFGALDAQTKIVLGQEFLRIWSENKRTAVFVTHDIGEAITMSDRIIVMSCRPGRIIADYAVDLPRPRDFLTVNGTARYAELYKAVWSALMQGTTFNRPNGKEMTK